MNTKNQTPNTETKLIAELAIANLATGFQMLARERADLARHFFAEAEKQAEDVKNRADDEPLFDHKKTQMIRIMQCELKILREIQSRKFAV
jgi:hypothetical protein